MLMLCATMLGNVTQSQFIDPKVPDAVVWAEANGLTKYSTPESFMVNNYITREQFAKFASAFGLSNLCLEADEDMECAFTDADEFDPTLARYVGAACQM